MENWKPVKGYEGLYEVSDLGNIRNRFGKVLKPIKRNHGYLAVMLYGKGGNKTRGAKTVSIHRLVAEAFIANPKCNLEVNHKDEDKQNNKAENLEWVTRTENVNYGSCQKRRSLKITNGKKSKAILQYTKDGKLVAEYPSFAEAERQTGFAKANLCRCAQGNKQYTHAYGFIWRYAS